jgi:hypothetical protein
VRSSDTVRALARIPLAGLFILLGAGVAAAQKTDSVWIRNGDRITGEVKSLSRGLLKYSTDDLGTISIEWEKVDRISTTTLLEVRLSSGERYFGPLRLARSRRVVVGTDTLPLVWIVSMTQIERTRLARINGYLDLGFSFQKADDAAQLSTGTRVEYREPGTVSIFEMTTFFENRDDAEETRRLSAAFTERVLLRARWSTGGIVGYDRNEELDLAGRARLVGFVGRTLSQSNRREFSTTAGLVLAEEWYFSTDSASGSFEGLVGIVYRAFRYDQPKLDAGVTSQAFPSLSTRGRVRLQNDLRLSYELISDFMLTLTVFDSYDSKPPAAGAPKNDFGTTLAVTWTF